MQMDKKETGKQENKDFLDTFWYREKVYNFIIGVSTYSQMLDIVSFSKYTFRYQKSITQKMVFKCSYMKNDFKNKSYLA